MTSNESNQGVDLFIVCLYLNTQNIPGRINWRTPRLGSSEGAPRAGHRGHAERWEGVVHHTESVVHYPGREGNIPIV